MMGKAARYALKGPLAVSEYAMLRMDIRSANARYAASLVRLSGAK